MTANDVVGDARVARVRELKAELAAVKARLAQAEADRDVLASHFELALVALRDFERAEPDGRLRIVDGWNVILRGRNVAKLSSEDISKLKAEYLAGLGIVRPVAVKDAAESEAGATRAAVESAACDLPPLATWIVFDGPEENSYRSGAYRVTYTGGVGAQRADRLMLDYVHAAKLLGMDVSRITVDTADKTLAKRLVSLGAKVDCADGQQGLAPDSPCAQVVA